MLSVDTNSLRHLQRRSRKNFDLQFANCDRLACILKDSYTSRVPVEGKSSVCVICMKYRIIILITIIISLGQIILSYMAYTSSTHSRMHAHTHRLANTPAHSLRRAGCLCSMGRCPPNHYQVNAPFSPVPLAMNGLSVVHLNQTFH